MILLVAAALLVSSACQKADTSGANQAEASATTEDASANMAQMSLTDAAPANNCPGENAHWSAFIQPVHGKRKLAVVGVITMGSGGYRFELIEGPLDKMLPPTQHFMLKVTPPSGPVIQPVIPQQVDKVIDAQPSYAAVVIDCDDKAIARITDIPEYPEIETGPAPVQPVERNPS
jgi:hypothetical protein